MSHRSASMHPVAVARRATQRRLRPQAATAGGEDGFTLIELLIVVVILPIVLGGIAAALLSVFGLENQTQNRIGDSNDAQVGSANFNKDVQSAEQLTTTATPACGPATGQTQVLGLEWAANSATTGGYDTVVSYVVVTFPPTRPNAPTTYSLIRQLCTSGPSTTPAKALTISHDVPAGFGTNPGDLTITPASVQTAAAAGWTSAQGVTGITFNITEPASNYSYSLVGLPGQSTSTGTGSNPQGNGPPGCSPANAGTGTYATQLCFVDFTSFAGVTVGHPCQTMTLPIANSPDILSFCITESVAGGVLPHSLPTYYNPHGLDSEAFLGNNGFYTGVPGNPALLQPINGGLVTVYLTNIQVKNAVGQPASGWYLVTGDAESTDANEWMVFQSNLNWSVLYNNGTTDPYGNSCYDTNDPNNVGFMQYIPTTPPTTNGPLPTASKASLPVAPAAFPQTGTSSVLCEASIQLNKTGTLMVETQEPSGSSAPQSLTVTMKGAGFQGMFLGLLL